MEILGKNPKPLVLHHLSIDWIYAWLELNDKDWGEFAVEPDFAKPMPEEFEDWSSYELAETKYKWLVEEWDPNPGLWCYTPNKKLSDLEIGIFQKRKVNIYLNLGPELCIISGCGDSIEMCVNEINENMYEGRKNVWPRNHRYFC